MITRAGQPRREGLSMEPVVRRLSGLSPLGEAPRRLLEGLGGRTETIPAKTTLQIEGEAMARPRYILAGWACRQRLLMDGRRQIFDLLLPGDGVGVCPEPGALALATTVALTAITTVDASPLLDERAPAASADILAAHRQVARTDEARLLDHVVRLGRQTAYERLAHLVLELHARLEGVNAVEEATFDFPLTQEVLADVLGLSVVHVNRTLQQFRRERLVDLGSGRLKLLRPDFLASIADFRSSL